jgi:hypothetical protein
MIDETDDLHRGLARAVRLLLVDQVCHLEFERHVGLVVGRVAGALDVGDEVALSAAEPEVGHGGGWREGEVRRRWSRGGRGTSEVAVEDEGRGGGREAWATCDSEWDSRRRRRGEFNVVQVIARVVWLQCDGERPAVLNHGARVSIQSDPSVVLRPRTLLVLFRRSSRSSSLLRLRRCFLRLDSESDEGFDTLAFDLPQFCRERWRGVLEVLDPVDGARRSEII